MIGDDVLFYMLRKNKKTGEFIYAVTKQTKKYLSGIIVYSTDNDLINQKFKLSKDSVSSSINEYDFTRSLEL